MSDQEKLRVGSVCSGVGGFELGLHRASARFDVRWMCEVLPQRRAILGRHWPDIPVHPDITELDPDALDPIDCLVGGTPCQDLSVAGKRSGLEGERSGLFWHFIRLRNSLVPRWTLWENVPGALSSNGGLDFALVLGAFVGAECHVPAGGWTRSGVAAGPWGGAVWRTLNSQHFGVPQRRHRLFVVGCLGGPVPSEVLLERAGGEGDSAASAEARPGAARRPRGEPKGAGAVGTPGGVSQSLTSRFGNSGADLPDAEAGWLVADEPDVADTLLANGSLDRNGKPGSRTDSQPLTIAPALTKRYQKGVTSDADDAVIVEGSPEVAAPLTRGSATGDGVSEPGRRQEDDVNLVAFDGTQGDAAPLDDMSPALRVGKGAAAPTAFVQNQREEVREVDQAMSLSADPGSHQDTRLAAGSQVRRLTPTECERLQGFPDGWTIPDGPSLADTPSYYQLGYPPNWELVAYTKRHAANHDEDYESWEEADHARTLVDGRLNGTLAVEPSCIHTDAIGRSGDSLTPSPDAEGRIRLRDAGIGVRDDGQSFGLMTGKPHAVGPVHSIRTAQQGANGIGVQAEVAPTCDETGAGAVAHALTSEGHDASEDGTGRGTPLVADAAPTLRSNPRNNSHPPTEADMLVTDGAGGVPHDPQPDAHRYAAMGDAVTVPVISFIGSRIAACDERRDPDG